MKSISHFIKKCWPLLFLLLIGAAQNTVFFSDSRWDTGTVSSQQLLSKVLTVTNRGSRAVHVSITGTCDCLTAVPEELTIQPGRAEKVILRYNPADDSGPVRKYFMIGTDDPGLERIIYPVQGTVNARNTDTTGDAGTTGNAEKSGWTGKNPKAGPEMFPKFKVQPLLYYYTAGCKKCTVFLNREIPNLERKLEMEIPVTAKDILQRENYEEYLQTLNTFGKKPKALPVVVVGNSVLQGEPEIRRHLARSLQNAWSQTNRQIQNPPKTPNETRTQADFPNLGRNLFVFPVILAGLLDGVNPCAFTTLIFLLSYLAFMGKNRREIMAIGLSFSLSVFITYYLIGLGLFRVLEFTQGFPWMAAALKWLLFALLLAFAVLSLLDYFKAKAGKTSEIILQLPDRFKQNIHRSIRTQAKSGALITSSLALGFLVSVFELACTGQVYFPTIAYLVQSQKQLSAHLMLGAYNLGFILPLLLVFYLTYRGTQSQRFAEIFRNHLVWVKLGLAMFFLGLALLVFFT